MKLGTWFRAIAFFTNQKSRSNEFCKEKLLTLISGGFLQYFMSKLENFEQSTKWKMHFSTGKWECFFLLWELFPASTNKEAWNLVKLHSKNSFQYPPMKMSKVSIKNGMPGKHLAWITGKQLSGLPELCVFVFLFSNLQYRSKVSYHPRARR